MAFFFFKSQEPFMGETPFLTKRVTGLGDSYQKTNSTLKQGIDHQPIPTGATGSEEATGA